jgi:sugar (pentulose or hexulose) kinase
VARGAFVGLTTRHGAAHMIRAVMEGVVFSLRDGLEIMRDLGLPLGEAVDRCVAVAGVTRPDPAAQARYEQVYVVYRDMYGALREGMHRLAAL